MNAADLVSRTDDKLRFGLNDFDIPAGLRKLADMIDGGQIVVQFVATGEDAGLDDFPMSRLTIVFSNYRSPPALVGDGDLIHAIEDTSNGNT